MPSQLKVILGVFKWTVMRDPTDDSQMVAECSALGLDAWGSTNDELVDCIQRVMGMLVEHLMKAGRLESFMASRGHSVVTTILEQMPEPMPEDGWVGPEVPVVWPTNRIVDASLAHA